MVKKKLLLTKEIKKCVIATRNDVNIEILQIKPNTKSVVYTKPSE